VQERFGFGRTPGNSGDTAERDASGAHGAAVEIERDLGRRPCDGLAVAARRALSFLTGSSGRQTPAKVRG
jgi:hypothetical protein